MSTTIDTTTTTRTAIPHVIGGDRVEADGRTGAVFNPATGVQTGDVALASADLVHAAAEKPLRAEAGAGAVLGSLPGQLPL